MAEHARFAVAILEFERRAIKISVHLVGEWLSG